MSFSVASSSDNGSSSQQIPSIPRISFTSVANLSDILRELPFVRPIDKVLTDLDLDSNEDVDLITQLDRLKLIDNKSQFEKSVELLNCSNDHALVDALSKLLIQVDTSRVHFKHDNNELTQKQQKSIYFSPLLKSLISHNTKIFNGILSENFNSEIQIKQEEKKSENCSPLSAICTENSTKINLIENQSKQSPSNTSNSPRQTQNQLVNQNVNYKQDTSATSAYKVVSDPTKLCVKLTRIDNSTHNSTIHLDSQKLQSPERVPITNKPTEAINTTSSFYSKSNDVKPNLTSSSNNTPLNAQILSKAKRIDKSQLDLKSQLGLPDDFTPELIQQLAAEGYDISGSGGTRKARTVLKSHVKDSFHSNKMLVDDSDSDNSNDESKFKLKKKSDKEYNPSLSNQKNLNNTPSKQQQQLNINNNLNPVRLNLSQRMNKKADLSGLEPTEHPSYKRFCQLLDDLLDSYEQDMQQTMNSLKKKSTHSDVLQYNLQNSDEQEKQEGEEEDIPTEYLLSRQVCADLVQEAFKLNSYSIMYLIKKENLVKLQNLLFYNIKDGIRSLHLMSQDSNEDKVLKDILIEKLLRASDCCIISLIIMTSEKIPKELIIEDIIEQITIFIKINLNETIFPYYDPVYHKPNTTNPNENSKPSSKRKLFIHAQNSSSSSSSSSNLKSSNHNNNSTTIGIKHINHMYNRMREVLNLISDLITQIDLTDTIVITLTSLSVMCFFVENINDLQLEALKILTNIFTRYEKHRQLVLDDILSSLAKLHSSKRNTRSYKCFNGDSIQMFTALILQLIQSEVNVLDETSTQQTRERENNNDKIGNIGNVNDESNNNNNHNNNGQVSFEEKETFLLNTFEKSNETAKKFLSVFFSKCKVKQADFDFRPLFENFIQDLLITVNKPEWPVSEVILNLLGIILVNQIQNDQSDVQSRVNSLEYLGQVVSQLRKDSLEYQKYPDKIVKVLDKFKITQQDINPSSIPSHQSIFALQKGLVSYINSLITNDQLHKYSKNFLVSQWLKELNQVNSDELANQSKSMDHGGQRVDVHDQLRQMRVSVYELIDQKDFAQCPSLDSCESFILSKYLTSLKKTLDKNFDFYLINIVNLTGSDSNTPTQVRSKAIKCLSLIIEADPQILLKQKVFACVEANFLHQTISVREASVDLIGRFITIMPELTNRYYKLLSDRILDVGVSVRKRVIKIFRDICINQPDFKQLTEICVKILRRINDEDNIKKLVIDTFYLIWFAPCDSKELWLKRVMNLVDVVSEFNVITNVAGMEFFESLFSSLIINQSNTSIGSVQHQQQLQQQQQYQQQHQVKLEESDKTQTSDLSEKEILMNRSKEVERSCKKIVDCLIENVLRTEANMSTKTTNEQDYKRLVSSFSTLYLLSKIKPDFFITHAETLLPYMNIKSTNASDTQIINSAAKILECVVPLLQSPSNSFLLSLEESLCKLIFQSGMMIVSSCISCLGTVVNKLTKNYKLAADCLYKFYNNTSYFKKTLNPKQLEASTKPMLFRVLFTLGLLSKNFDVESDDFKDFKICTKSDLFQTFLHFITNFDFDVQHKALIGLGYFLTRNSDYMIRDEIKNLYLKYIKSDETKVPSSLKSQVFANLTDYLNEEDQRNLHKSVELAKTHNFKDDLKEMLDVQSGMASTIIQSYLKPILESYLTSNSGVRLSIFNCLSMILNQGLVYPIECVPYLIAMTTDNEKKIQTKSLIHLTNLQKAHPNFVQSKSIAGINISFLLQKVINKELDDCIIRGFSETTEVLSLNHHLYTLLRSNRSYRRAFIQQLLKMFDDSTTNRNHTTLAHMLFISDNLAYFPYQLTDEPLYIIHHIDLIISCTGINLLQTFKENLINYKSNCALQKSKIDCESELAMLNNFDMFSQLECPQEVDDNEEHLKIKLSDSNRILTSKVKQEDNDDEDDDDDENETFESVYKNLPDDLRPLKECMYRAQGCCLLLILKMFLKEVYTISDSKIQSYSPSDTAKVNDRPLTSRKTNRRFNPKQIIDYIIRYKNSQLDQDKLKESLVNEYLEFKELILAIDQEEMSKMDENRPSSNAKSNNSNDVKLTVLQQKLYEGIEKTRGVTGTPGGNASGQDSTFTTPSKSKTKHKRGLSSSAKKLSNKKRRRKKDSDASSDDDFEMTNSDFEED